MSKESRRLATKAIHAGEPEPRIMGSVTVPIFQSAMFETSGGEGYHNTRYLRLSNSPNHTALHGKLAALENAEAGLVTASGMAAISTALLTVLRTGDHLLIQGSLYGGTHDFVTHDFERFGIAYDFIDGDDASSWKAKLKPNTKAIYVEAMSNPTLTVSDLKSAGAFGKEHGIVSMIDNTFASPVNFRPAEWGFDLSLHSCTKYLNGHSDIVAGAVIGRGDLVEKVRHTLNHLGGSLDPHACFLLDRGIKTLVVRMKHHNESALTIARFLAGHSGVARVNHPGLDDHPRHARAEELFDGYGGMLSFEPKGGVKAAEKFIEGVTVPIRAPSLGGVESLVTRPSTTSHSGMAPAERKRLGVSDSLVRVSIGLEATEDLIEDFDRVLRD